MKHHESSSELPEIDRALYASNFRLSEIFKFAPQAVIVIDESQFVKEWNVKAEEIFGYKNDEVIDKPLSEIIIPFQYREAHRTGMQHFLKTGEGPVLNRTIQVNGLNKAGEEFPISLSISNIKVSHTWLFVGFISDLRESKKAEEAFIKQELALRQSQLDGQRNKEFLTLASHELKTPLTSIKALTQIALKEAGEKPVEQTQYLLKRIEDQSTKMSKLINDILDISRFQSGKLTIKIEEVALISFIKPIVDTCQILFPSHIISLTPFNDIKLSLDPLRIEQVLINLISNAVKYSKEKDLVEISLALLYNKVLISIKDQGVGIDIKQHDKVFDKFYRVDEISKNDTSGLGIGLYISSEIIKLHGGEIWVESEVSKGSVFNFTLPTD